MEWGWTTWRGELSLNGVGCLMKSNKAFLFLTIAACLSLISCYHEFPKGGGGGGGGGNNNGNTFLNITVSSTPSTTFSFPSLTWQIGGLSLINSAGTSVQLTGASAPLLNFTTLQTDSSYLGHMTIGATSYTKLQVQFNTPLFSYFYNSTNATLLGCASGVVCLIPNTVPGFSAGTVTVPITYTATANANTGIRINFDFSKAVTSAGGMTFDFTQPGAITLIALPLSNRSQTSGLDTVDNFTGVVSAKTSTSVTASSFSSEARTFTMAAGVEFDDPFSICPPPASFNCLAVNQNVSIDGVLNSDGTMTADEVEFLDPAPGVNELEGIITSPVANNQFKMALTNGVGSAIFIVSSPVTVNLNNAATFFVDPKNLGISSSPLGFQSQSDLVMGQTVMIRGGTITNGTTTVNNPTRVLLRYSSIGGLVQAPGNPIFTLSGVSPFFTNLVANSVQVNTFPNTTYDNISNFSGLVGGTTNASVRGLYLNPNSGALQPLLAAKIRAH
jgi:hypothetical protein